jgi:hypothetical protein
MKTDYKYLHFIEIYSKTKTKKFEVMNISNDLLGYVQWYAPWRKYCFYVESPGLVFDAGCLADIQEFITNLMAEWKANRTSLKTGED